MNFIMQEASCPDVPQRAKKRKQETEKVESNNAVAVIKQNQIVFSVDVGSNLNQKCHQQPGRESEITKSNAAAAQVAQEVERDQRDSRKEKPCSSKSCSSSNPTTPDAFEIRCSGGNSNHNRNSSKKADVDKRKSTTSSSHNNSIKIHGKKSSLRKTSSNRLSQQIVNWTAFETFQKFKSVSMSLDWIHFKIRGGDDEAELFQAVQSKYCSLSVTNSNEIFIRKPNAENVLRIHSTIVEDVRNFDFYTNCEKYVGSLTCDARQTFKLPCKIENKLTGEIYSVTVQREGEMKFWEIAFVPANLIVANVKVHIGHRWKSVYKLTFLEEISISNQILLLGFLLALASARLESEVVPVFFAVSAILVTFIIFFIIQFT